MILRKNKKMFKLLGYIYIIIALLTVIKEDIKIINDNNNSKYFQKSLNDFNNKVKSLNKWEKYYENYSNNTKYLYYKYKNNNEYNIIELIINNEIIINNNSYYSYNSHYSYSHSLFHNMCCSDYNGCYSCDNNHSINKNNIMKILTDIHYDDNRINQTLYGRHIITNLNNYSYKLEKNKGLRMIKHELLNNIPEYINSNYNILTIESYYFIEKVYIKIG